jgi:hypothetical protein
VANSLHDSRITVGNGGIEPARAQLTFFYHGGQDKYQVEQTLAPEEQMWLDLGQLIRDQVPGKDGKTIPPEVTSGVPHPFSVLRERKGWPTLTLTALSQTPTRTLS